MIEERRAWLFVFLLLLLGAGLRFTGLGRESLWNDELHSRYLSGALTVREVISKTLSDDGQPPLHGLILHGIERVWGDSEVDLRFPSALAGVLSIPAIFVLGRLLYGTAEGLLGAGLLTVLWCPIFYSQEARPYGLLLFAVLAGACCWIALLRRWNETGDTPWGLAAGYVAAAWAACYLHHFGAGLVFFEGVLALFLTRRRLAVLALWGVTLVGYVPGIFYLLFQRRHTGSWAWIQPPGFDSAVEYLKFLFNYSRSLAEIVAALWLLGLLRALSSRRPERRVGPLPASALLALWLAVPFAGAVAASYLTFPILTSRNLIVSLPAAYLLVAHAVVLVTGRGWRLPVAGVLLVAGLLAQLLFGIRYYEVPTKDQFREAVAEVVAGDSATGRTVVIGRAYHAEYFDYYFVRQGSSRRVDLVAGSDADLPRTRELLAARRPDRVWLLAGHLTVEDGFLAFLRGRYRERLHRAFQGTEVWLFSDGL
jgi:mannosyltransferase